MARPIKIQFTEEEKEILKQQYHLLWKYDLMKLIPNYNWKQIQFQAKKLGLSKSNIRTSKLKFLLDDNLINYYWYGFIMSDGHLSEKNALIISLNKTDLNHLEKISNKIGCNILKSEKSNMVTINIMDNINILSLKEKLGINHNKTYNPPTVEHMSNLLNSTEKLLSFLIGFIDGDGSIQYQKDKTTFKSLRIHIHSSWFNIMDWISIELNKLGMNSSCVICNRGYTQLNICSIKNYQIFKNFINNNNIPILERKWK